MRNFEPGPAERVLELPQSGGTDLRYALVYPNRHGLAMANLGVQSVLGLLSSLPGAACHRAFGGEPRTREAGRPLADYDVVALSLSFEGDYPEALKTLTAGGVPLRTADRTADHPLVLAGGVAPTLNPEPLAPFADAAFLGEAEAGLADLHGFLRAHRGLGRPELLTALADARLPGVYVPSRYEVTEEDGVPRARRPLGRAPEGVERRWAPCPWEPARTRVLAPGDAFGGTYLLEVSRGCPHGCRFCAAGHVTRPARFLPPDSLLPWIRFGAREVGKLGFVGAAVSDHPDFDELARATLAAGAKFTVSSFRAENLDPQRLDLLARGGLRTLTVALEAGTAALRRRLGKAISQEDLLRAARLAGEAGLDGLRIYAMVGLPGEEDADVVALAEAAVEARRAMGRGTVTVSAAPFVPKPHTPLQWEAMASEAVLKRRIRVLERACAREKGVRAVAEAPKWSRIQGLLSRGGRSVAALLEAASRTGDWRTALRSPLAARTLDRERDRAEALPWDFVCGVPARAYLAAAADAAPCRPPACRVCGVCRPAPPEPGASGAAPP
ncbi:MAG: radical SAM protein [Deferrisomatales bacterium]